MVYQKDKIIVLKTLRYMESHLIVKGLNSEGSVLSFFARSALKSRKRFSGGVLEAGNYIFVEYSIPSREEGWNQLKSAEVLLGFRKIRTDYDRLKLCLYILKMVDKVGGSGFKGDAELFHLLGNVLKSLEISPDLQKLKLFFEIRFLYIQGVLPFELQGKNLFLENFISRHHQVNLEQENIPVIQSQVQTALSQYLD